MAAEVGGEMSGMEFSNTYSIAPAFFVGDQEGLSLGERSPRGRHASSRARGPGAAAPSSPDPADAAVSSAGWTRPRRDSGLDAARAAELLPAVRPLGDRPVHGRSRHAPSRRHRARTGGIRIRTRPAPRDSPACTPPGTRQRGNWITGPEQVAAATTPLVHRSGPLGRRRRGPPRAHIGQARIVTPPAGRGPGRPAPAERGPAGSAPDPDETVGRVQAVFPDDRNLFRTGSGLTESPRAAGRAVARGPIPGHRP